MDGNDLQRLVLAALGERQRRQLLRGRRVVRAVDAVHVELEGRRYVNFASNNYLGLTHHPRVVEAMRGAVAESGAGAGAAGLITGYGPGHASAEAAVAAWKGMEACVLLPSGYQANHAAVQALAGVAQGQAGVRFLLDKLVHASLVDAVRGSGRAYRVFPHNHLGKLGRLLAEAPAGQLQVVVTESIFSMDGDAADLVGLAELKAGHPFVLLLDEAHGSGVYGPAGAGYAAECGLGTIVDVSVVTFSKALGCMGGGVCGSRALAEAVVNFAPAAIFSTGVAPAVAAGVEAAVGVLRDEPQRQGRVRELARRVRGALGAKGLALPAGDSPIIPVILGDEAAALGASEALLGRGLLVPAVRPPTVARGTSRLRITLSSEHTDEEVERLVAAVGG